MAQCKWNWYQNDYNVFINLLRLNVDPSKCKIILLDRQITVNDGEKDIFTCNLFGDVEEAMDVSFSANKAELNLQKKIAGKWDDLEAKKEVEVKQAPKIEKQWEKLAKEAEQDPECADDDGVNKFFKQIYDNLDDDGKKAMMKSMQESAGTVLSTNWSDVKKSKVDCKPPEGLEFKKY
ncbi:unnamed protein product [Bursaphelenchus okinawaensis]|uniref:SGS domain-containing protein n=1 Tax=Bursaphelenchus okinawaensis TaxID=465554 RepID=A0A811JTH9_9BILA|nr:unnamed protein product [Bursaphelenchus okinawaensis]CAG9082323.1 unnamed protein product [Bursaphelenchus okinawaensis]